MYIEYHPARVMEKLSSPSLRREIRDRVLRHWFCPHHQQNTEIYLRLDLKSAVAFSSLQALKPFLYPVAPPLTQAADISKFIREKLLVQKEGYKVVRNFFLNYCHQITPKRKGNNRTCYKIRANI